MSSRPVPKPAPCHLCRRVSTPRTWGGLALSAWCPLHPPPNLHSHTHTGKHTHSCSGTVETLSTVAGIAKALQEDGQVELDAPGLHQSDSRNLMQQLSSLIHGAVHSHSSPLEHTCPDFFKILNPHFPHFYNVGWNKGWLCAT